MVISVLRTSSAVLSECRMGVGESGVSSPAVELLARCMLLIVFEKGGAHFTVWVHCECLLFGVFVGKNYVWVVSVVSRAADGVGLSGCRKASRGVAADRREAGTQPLKHTVGPPRDSRYERFRGGGKIHVEERGGDA